MNMVAYCRVSTDTEDQLNSLQTQREFFEEYAKKNNYNLIKVYADEHAIIGTSGENLVKSRVSALVPFNFFVKGKYNFI